MIHHIRKFFNNLNTKQILVLLFLFNLYSKLIFIEHNDVAGDEPFTLFYAQQNLADILELLPKENNPPFHFIFLHFWIKLFGSTVFSIRLPSVIASALTACVIYLLGKTICNKRVGLFSALAFSLSSFVILHSHESRVYAIFVLFHCFSLLLILRKKTEFKYLFALSLSNGILLYSHFLSWISLSIQGLLILFLFIKEWKKLRAFSLCILSSIVLYTPYLPLFLKRLSDSGGGTWVETPAAGKLYEIIRVFSNQPVVAVVVLLGILTSLVLLFIPNKRKQAITTSLLFIVPYLGMFLISQKLAMFTGRYLLFCLPFLFLTSIFGLSEIIRSEKLKFILPSLLIVLLVATVDLNPSNKRNPSKIAELISNEKQDNTLLILSPPWIKLNLVYYLNNQAFKDHEDFDKYLIENNIVPVIHINELDKRVLLTQDHILYLGGWDMENSGIELFLDQNFDQKHKYPPFSGYQLLGFSKN